MIFFIERRYNKLLERAKEFGYQFNADFHREKGLCNNISSFIDSPCNTSFFKRLQSFIPGTKAHAYRTEIAANLDTLSKFVEAAPITIISRRNVINTYQKVLAKRDKVILTYSPQLQSLKRDLQAKDNQIKELESEIRGLQNSLKNSQRQIEVLEDNAGQVKRNQGNKAAFFKAKPLDGYACNTRERVSELDGKRNKLLGFVSNMAVRA